MEERRRNILLGASLIAMGLIFAIGAVFASMRIAPQDEQIDLAFYTETCKAQASRFDFVATEMQGNLNIWGRRDHVSTSAFIDRISALLGFCPAHEMSFMCAGAECDGSAKFHAILSPIDP